MRIEYVFIRKENTLTKIAESISTTNPLLHVVLRKIFDSVSQESINLKYKSKEYSVSYRYVEHECENADINAEMQYLVIELDGKSKSRVAEVLDTVHHRIFSHDEKKNYDIIVSYDGLSKYYCDRLYPLLNEFERQIRNLIFKLLTRSFGALWLNKTVTEEQQNNIKARLQIKSKPLRNQKMIEEALYEMDIKELENYLFIPRSGMPAAELRTEEFANEKLKELSQEDAIVLIQKLRPISIWERYFDEEVNIPNLQEKLDNIRIYRNKVAHAKCLHKDDYTACKVILTEILPQLETAIQDVSVREYDTEQLEEVVRGMADTCTSAIKHAMDIGRTLSPALEMFSRSLAEYGDLFQQSAVSKALGMQNHFAGMHQSMIELSSVLGTLPSQSIIQSAMQLQNLFPPAPVMESIAMAQAHLPEPSVIKSIELASKAMPSPSVISAYQNAHSYLQQPAIVKSLEVAAQMNPLTQMPAVASLLRTSQMIEQITRFQNLDIATYESMEDSEENDDSGETSESKDGHDSNDE